MQINKHPNETTEHFLARAFRWNKLCGEAFARRQARYSATPATAEKLRPRIQVLESGGLDYAPSGARPMTRDELLACGTSLAFGPTPRMSRLRAIWYGAGLVAAVAVVVVAVFGMGQ